MKIKDIVNHDAVTLTNCEHEPIHIPGSIQPHGFLVGLKRPDLNIDFCSGNVFEYVGVRYEQLLGKGFHLVFGEEPTNKLQKYISTLHNTALAPLTVELMGKLFTCTVSRDIDLYILEFEIKYEDIVAVPATA